MLIVGTVIGAGFATGAEIVSFFGSDGISPLIAGLCTLLIFGGCVLFLYLGSRYKPNDIGELNYLALGKGRPILDGFMLLNSLVVTAGMLAAFDSIGRDFCSLPLFSLVFGALAAVVVSKGINGVIKVNAVALPAVVVTLIIATSLNMNSSALSFEVFRIRPLTCLTYVSMNMLLAAGTLGKVHDLKKSEILLSSGIAAAVIGALMCCIVLSLNSTRFSSSMPTLEMARAVSPILFAAMVVSTGVSVFTTLISAMTCLTDYAAGIVKNRTAAAWGVLIVGALLSLLGFEKVVGYLYPAIGALGVGYIILNVILCLRSTGRKKKKYPDRFERSLQRGRDL